MKMKKRKKRPKIKTSQLGNKIKRWERQFLVAWIRYSQAHRHSNRLPILLFCLLFLDGFVMFIPSSFLLIASVTISPQRWSFFGLLFAAATFLNNICTYMIARYFPPDFIMEAIKFFNAEYLWTKAQEALESYGAYATFVGSFISLPTQMMTAIMGIADSQAFGTAPILGDVILPAVLFVLLGNAIKGLALGALARFGWIRMERKFGSKNIVKT